MTLGELYDSLNCNAIWVGGAKQKKQNIDNMYDVLFRY